MAIRIPATISGSTVRISNDDLYDIDPPYDNEVLSYGPVSFSTSSMHGGYLKPRLGSISLSPRIFEGNFPPPQTASFPLYWDDTLLIDADAYLKNYTRSSVNYALHGNEYTSTVSSTTYNANLLAIFSSACATLGLSLDITYATDYAIYYPVTDVKLLIDILDKMAAYANHGFYITGGKLYLIDLAKNNGTLTLDEFDFKPASYPGGTAYSLFKAGDYTVTGSSAIGTEYTVSDVFSNVQANIEAQLARTKTIMEKPRVSISIPIGSQSIVYGQKISFVDESIAPGSDYITVDMWARSFSYSIRKAEEWVTISGEADIT